MDKEDIFEKFKNFEETIIKDNDNCGISKSEFKKIRYLSNILEMLDDEKRIIEFSDLIINEEKLYHEFDDIMDNNNLLISAMKIIKLNDRIYCVDGDVILTKTEIFEAIKNDCIVILYKPTLNHDEYNAIDITVRVK